MLWIPARRKRAFWTALSERVMKPIYIFPLSCAYAHKKVGQIDTRADFGQSTRARARARIPEYFLFRQGSKILFNLFKKHTNILLKTVISTELMLKFFTYIDIHNIHIICEFQMSLHHLIKTLFLPIPYHLNFALFDKNHNPSCMSNPSKIMNITKIIRS